MNPEEEYYPVFDRIVKDFSEYASHTDRKRGQIEYGRSVAMVYGIIYRNTKFQGGLSIMSQKVMSDLAGIGIPTLRDHVRKLVDHGYIELVGTSPNGKGGANIYKVTGK